MMYLGRLSKANFHCLWVGKDFAKFHMTEAYRRERNVRLSSLGLIEFLLVKKKFIKSYK